MAASVRLCVLSLSARSPDGDDAAYIEWHSLDHLPEQYSLRLEDIWLAPGASALASFSPDNIQHSRTSGCARTKSSNALRSASAWLDRCTMANTVTS